MGASLFNFTSDMAKVSFGISPFMQPRICQYLLIHGPAASTTSTDYLQSIGRESLAFLLSS